MTVASPLELLALLGTFLCCLLAVFLFVVPTRNRLAHAMLASFLLLTGVDMSAWFMGTWWQANSALAELRGPLSLLQNPLFAGFIWFSCFTDKTLRPHHALHATPAVVVFALGMARVELSGWLWAALLHGQYFAYIAAACWVLWRFRSILKFEYSNIRSATLEWLTAMVGASLIAHSVFLLRVLLRDIIDPSAIATLQVVTAVLVLSITLWIAFRALLTPHLFRGVDSVLAAAALEMHAEDDEGSGRISQVEAHLQAHRSYLDPDLSLPRLARQIGWSQKDLSETINRRTGQHFFDFINGHRVEHAKTLLIEESAMSVIDIMHASGFNSKSSFNTAFKKHQGQTPTAFRNSPRT